MKQSWPIPAHLVKYEKVDLENEALSALGASVSVGLCHYSKPLVLGVMSMLEIMDNALLKKIFTNDETIEPVSEDLWAIFYLNKYREKALEDVREWYRGNRDPLKKKIKAFGKEYKINDIHYQYVLQQIERSVLGFRMIPGKGGGSEMIYGAESIANISFICSTKMNIPYDKVVWETPLTLIGHIVALHAIENGKKNVERPYDTTHLEWFEETCEKCDELHELYPWQEENPFKTGVYKWQHEEVMDKWVAVAHAWIEKNGAERGKDNEEIIRVKGMYKDIRFKYLKELKTKEVSNG